MNNSMITKVSETLNKNVLQQNPEANVEKSERLVSLGAGAFLALKGLTNVFSHPWLAIAELGIGGSLLYRGVTGYCAVKEKLENEIDNSVRVPQSAMPTEAY
ncbi:YgaP family membrane protein [Desertivirga arenae]|uniref:YgaP family membrane protein n=1 Tax=Desertivirga arenae TaxID=2810309 RepID=UPI001A95788D|nr:DUF2892 domain-containing protein [Pedobacter sp. SYSU D00823]